MKRFRTYEKTILVLETLKEAAQSIGELTGLINDLPGPYYKSFIPKEEYKKRIKRHHQRLNKERDEEQRRMEKRKLQNMISLFQKEGLVKKSDRRLFWQITDIGLKKLKLLKSKIIPSPTSYSVSTQKNFIIIAFDIPEHERRKRDWLRSVLKNLGCKMLQESVWVSECELPINLIQDLKKHKIIEYVKFFSVHKKGNIVESKF